MDVMPQHGALFGGDLLSQPSDVLASYGLDDLDAFLSRLIVSAYPRRSTT
ncbi:hypothetical protein [Nonomuraea dietziae]